jgi:hypothetical protein
VSATLALVGRGARAVIPVSQIRARMASVCPVTRALDTSAPVQPDSKVNFCVFAAKLSFISIQKISIKKMASFFFY